MGVEKHYVFNFNGLRFDENRFGSGPIKLILFANLPSQSHIVF
jgi:hypothetical protein